MNYDEMNLQSLEQQVDLSKATHEQHHKIMIEALASIERRQLHKQNKRYKNTSFQEYLRSRFDMTYGAYQQAKTAYVRAPEVVQALGPGTARRTIAQIGLEGAKKAVEAAARRTHTTPDKLPHDAVVQAVADEIKSVQAKRKKAKKEDIRPTIRELVDKDKIIADLRAELAEREEQVEKLKQALAERDARIAELLCQRKSKRVKFRPAPKAHCAMA